MDKTKPCLCFDFDGTIVDSFEIFAEKIQFLAAEFGYRAISQDEIKRLREKDAMEAFKSLNIPPNKVGLFFERMRQEVGNEVMRLVPARGIAEALKSLHKEGYLMGIVSSNSEETVKAFLSSHRLKVFDFFCCGYGLSGKADALGRVLRDRHLKPQNVVYIADEVRDAEAARQVGIRFGVVSWGFSAIERFDAYSPDYVFEKPADIPLMLRRANKEALAFPELA